MNTLIRHIEYLISRKDCVIIPDFGAILATYVSAEYNADLHMFMPPKRIFAFNSELKHNDGLLATSIQRAECISYECAVRKVHAGTDALLSALKQNGYVALGAVGVVTSDPGLTNMSFKPSEADSLSVASLWLQPIEVEERVADKGIIMPAVVQKSSGRVRRIVRTAAAVALLIGIGFVTSTPITVDTDTMRASLAPELTQVTTADILPVKESASEVNAATEEVAATVNADQAECDEAYYVIVASLSTRAEADKYLKAHRDPDLRILEKGKYLKIYNSKHHDVYAAYRAANKASKKYEGAWVYSAKME